ncbi:helix-turn-helix transcriptional regulator [Synechococcus sp. BA-124 BA4]|jgi:DNA-binding NarL/FixJ family response regulator|uniref:response regulator transcription factor n=1 Tax=unclassified Synechococcus TaxID=2626047 RepID=UPI002AD4EEA3|nr:MULTISPECIES: helix-turn-helix transcriptional regulator [unclassified Synechococcus]MEA5401056.1 helix-turn-helix transcriptional regulator [Synechococcus sp. BA-124 BA4]
MTHGDPMNTPSPAERRVLEGLCRGLSNKAIAAELVLSPRTVESHISSLLAKTGRRNRCQLLLWAQLERYNHDDAGLAQW